MVDEVDKANNLKCTQNMEQVLRFDNHVHKMAESIEALGCKLPMNFFTCRKCSVDITGGFKVEAITTNGSSSSAATDYIPKIIACENKAQNETYDSLRNTIVHELVHAYDLCRSNLDTRNCKILACTEIRATALSGECDVTSNFARGKAVKLTGPIGDNFMSSYKDCVRRRAVQSLNLTSHCKEVSEKAVDAVFNTCYRDEAPLYPNDIDKAVERKSEQKPLDYKTGA
jgi:inner membrane protease ATP23